MVADRGLEQGGCRDEQSPGQELSAYRHDNEEQPEHRHPKETDEATKAHRIVAAPAGVQA
jgi:hypothetical protein